MVNKEELAAAIEDADYRLEQGNSISPPYVDRTLLTLAAAARERLAALDAETDTSLIREV